MQGRMIQIMQKLFLASYAVVTLDLIKPLLPKPAHQTPVAFITTAADPYEDKSFLELDRNKLLEMGFSVTDVDLKVTQNSELEKILNAVELIFVAGGNTFYLLDQARKSGFAAIVKKCIENGTIYVGSSAGSALCCPTIEHAKEFDDPALAPDLNGDFTGLNLIPEILIPHAQKEKYFDRITRARTTMEANGFNVVTLTDEQVFVVIGDESKIISL
jgi:dipeptidase E